MWLQKERFICYSSFDDIVFPMLMSKLKLALED